ncbi:uncharacterized protein METZ01_LOCUS215740, partial [marine metagenome]
VLVPLGQGLWSDLGAEERTRVEKLEHNYDRMLGKVQKAKDKGKTAKAAKLQKNADNLNNAIARTKLKVVKAENTATVLIIAGLIGLLLVKLFEGAWANAIYEKHYSRWRTQRGAKSGLSWTTAVIAAILVAAVYATTLYRFTVAIPPEFLVDFPVEKATYQEPATQWIDAKFDAAAIKFGDFFQSIAKGIRIVLEALETMLVDTPWPVVMSVIVITAWRLAGPRVAIFTIAALAYLAVLGYWEKSMSTVALLGTAALICILVGVPLGVWFSRSERAYSVGRPALDFMQSMPAFVYLIPVIA